PVDHLVAPTIAENGLDFDRAPPGERTRLRRVIGDKPAPELASVLAFQHHGVAALEASGHGLHADGQQALSRAQRALRAAVDDNRSLRRKTARDPALARLRRVNPREEQRRAR